MTSQDAPTPHGNGSHGFFGSTQPRIVFGLSMKPGKHVHLAIPLGRRVHCVLGPHDEIEQASFGGKHGTLGGVPSYSGKQKQTGVSLTTRQPLFAPQTFG